MVSKCFSYHRYGSRAHCNVRIFLAIFLIQEVEISMWRCVYPTSRRMVDPVKPSPCISLWPLPAPVPRCCARCCDDPHRSRLAGRRHALLSLLTQPSMNDVGVDALSQGHAGHRGPCDAAFGHNLILEFWAVGTPLGTWGDRLARHGVHDLQRAHHACSMNLTQQGCAGAPDAYVLMPGSCNMSYFSCQRDRCDRLVVARLQCTLRQQGRHPWSFLIEKI